MDPNKRAGWFSLPLKMPTDQLREKDRGAIVVYAGTRGPGTSQLLTRVDKHVINRAIETISRQVVINCRW
jgi:hypothetical protein